INASGTGGAHTLALFDKDPRYGDKPDATAGSFASNVDTTSMLFTSSPSWTCAANITINSGTDANGAGATVPNTCGGPAITVQSSCSPTSVACITSQTASGGPKVLLIKLTSLTVNSGRTITLTGTLPVIFAVNGNVNIVGTIDASAATTTAG